MPESESENGKMATEVRLITAANATDLVTNVNRQLASLADQHRPVVSIHYQLDGTNWTVLIVFDTGTRP